MQAATALSKPNTAKAPKPKRAKASTQKSQKGELDWYDLVPFVNSATKGGRDFWCVPETGDYGMDRALGTQLAVMMFDAMRRYPCPIGNNLSLIIESMVKKGRYGGVEMGFIYEIEQRALNRR